MMLNIPMVAKDSLYNGNQTLSKISEAVDEIIENGVGYDDSIGTIAIPLLIALFAFAFPFLFSVITHINSKYDSESITQMFSKGYPYRAFLGMSLLAAIILAAVEGLSLFLPGNWHHVFMIIANVLLIVASAVYSGTILWFVKTCISYNNPTDIPGLIEQQYKRDLKEAEKKLAVIERKKTEIRRISDENKRNIRLRGLQIEKFYSKYDAKQSRANRYSDLCSHAVRKRNNVLFTRILLRMAEIAKEEMKLPVDENQYHVNTFYTGVVGKCSMAEYDTKAAEKLLSYWFSSFSRYHEPWMRAIVDMITSVIQSAQKGHTGLLEYYIKEAANGFQFIRRVPQVAFVRGESTDEQISLEKEVGYLWNSLVEIHYFLSAYLFSKNYYQVVKIQLAEANHWYKCLYPKTSTECLAMYAQCKMQQDDSGGFHSWYSNLLVGEIIDPELLERYTVFRLLITKEIKIPFSLTIGEKKLYDIKDGKENMKRIAEVLQRDVRLVSMFPAIVESNFGELFDNSVKALEKSLFLQTEKEQRGLLHRIIMEWFVCPNKRAENHTKVYDAVLPEELKENIKTIVGNILHGNLDAITRHLKGVNDESKTCVMNLGTYSFTVSKRLLFESMEKSRNSFFYDFTLLFNARYQYLVLEAIKIMGTEEVRISPDDFEDYYRELTQQSGNDYVLISINSPMTAFLKYDNHPTRGYTHNQTCHESEVHQLDIDTSWYLRDLPEVDEFRHTLLIMKKKDLPVMEPVIRGNRCIVKMDDLSDKERGVADVRITIDTNLRLCYDRHAKVIKVITGKVEL